MGEKFDFKVPPGTPCIHAGCATPALFRHWSWARDDEQDDPPEERAVHFACMAHLSEIPFVEPA